MEPSFLLKKKRSTIMKEFAHAMENVINSEGFLAIFKGLHLTSIDEILSMPISKLKDLSILPVGQDEKLGLSESEIKLI